jgi:Trypsin-co-occurring domain 1
MSEVQEFLLEDENGKPIKVFIESKSKPEIVERSLAQRPGGMGVVEDTTARLQDARAMIRAYTRYALSAFQGFQGIQIEEVNLKFGLKIGAKGGFPFITEGNAESNLEISVTCKLPT